jgi:transposase
MYAKGLSFRTIAGIFGIGYGTVRRAFHGQAPHGADTGPSEIRLSGKSTKTRGKLKIAAA